MTRQTRTDAAFVLAAAAAVAPFALQLTGLSGRRSASTSAT